LNPSRRNWGLRDYGVEGQIGLEPGPEEYVQKLASYFHEVKRVLKPSGSLYINLGDTYSKKNLQMIPARVALALQKDTWILRNDVIWYKPNHMPSSVKDRLTNTYEHLFHFVKSRKYYFDLDPIRVPHKTGPTSFNYRVREAKKGHIEIVGVRASFEEVKEYDNQGQRKDSPIDSIRYSTKFDKGSRIYNLLQNKAYARKVLGKGHDTALNHPLGKNPGDVIATARDFKGIPNRHHGSGPPDINKNREGHPCGKNPGDVVDWREELLRTKRPIKPSKGVSLGGGHLGLRGRSLNTDGRPLYPLHHPCHGNGWEASKPHIKNHTSGKNPGDVVNLNQFTKYKGNVRLRQDENLGGKVGLAEFRDKCRTIGVVEGHSIGKNPGDFWEIKPKPFLGAHFAVYPEALCLRPIISSCPKDGIVLDPFVGSGTTVKVALELGRNAIGIELNPNYVDIIKKRVPAVKVIRASGEQ